MGDGFKSMLDISRCTYITISIPTNLMYTQVKVLPSSGVMINRECLKPVPNAVIHVGPWGKQELGLSNIEWQKEYGGTN